MSASSRWVRRTAVATAATGAAGLVWAAGVEVRSFRLRRVEVPVLPPGATSLRVLHLSDLHLTPGQHRKREWVRSLAGLEPDLVVTTGDNLAHPDAVPSVLAAYEGLLRRPGVFVFGSNDYHAPMPKNPLRYLSASGHGRPETPSDLPWPELRDAFEAAGWLDLTNRRATMTLEGVRIAFAGVDDPHLERDRYPAPAASDDPDNSAVDDGADLRVGVAHAPYLRVLDAMVADHRDLLLAGHTHGGQLCVPGHGALVTNCDLDPARAKGLSRHPVDGREGAAWLHVSAGLGTSPYAPVRFACPPEATLLTLVPG